MGAARLGDKVADKAGEGLEAVAGCFSACCALMKAGFEGYFSTISDMDAVFAGLRNDDDEVTIQQEYLDKGFTVEYRDGEIKEDAKLESNKILIGESNNKYLFIDHKGNKRHGYLYQGEHTSLLHQERSPEQNKKLIGEILTQANVIGRGSRAINFAEQRHSGAAIGVTLLLGGEVLIPVFSWVVFPIVKNVFESMIRRTLWAANQVLDDEDLLGDKSGPIVGHVKGNWRRGYFGWLGEVCAIPTGLTAMVIVGAGRMITNTAPTFKWAFKQAFNWTSGSAYGDYNFAHDTVQLVTDAKHMPENFDDLSTRTTLYLQKIGNTVVNLQGTNLETKNCNYKAVWWDEAEKTKQEKDIVITGDTLLSVNGLRNGEISQHDSELIKQLSFDYDIKKLAINNVRRGLGWIGYIFGFPMGALVALGYAQVTNFEYTVKSMTNWALPNSMALSFDYHTVRFGEAATPRKYDELEPGEFLVVESMKKVKGEGEVKESKPIYKIYWQNGDGSRGFKSIGVDTQLGRLINDHRLVANNNTSTDSELLTNLKFYCEIKDSEKVRKKGALGTVLGMGVGVIGFVVVGITRIAYSIGVGFSYGFQRGINKNYFASHEGFHFKYNRVETLEEKDLPANFQPKTLYLVKIDNKITQMKLYFGEGPSHSSMYLYVNPRTQKLIDSLSAGNISASNRELIEGIMHGDEIRRGINLSRLELSSRFNRFFGRLSFPLGRLLGDISGFIASFIQSGVEGFVYGVKAPTNAPLYKKWEFTYAHDSVGFVNEEEKGVSRLPTFEQLEKHPEQFVVVKDAKENYTVSYIQNGERKQQKITSPDLIKTLKKADENQWIEHERSVYLAPGVHAPDVNELNQNPERLFVVTLETPVKPEQYIVRWTDAQGTECKETMLGTYAEVEEAFKKKFQPAEVNAGDEAKPVVPNHTIGRVRTYPPTAFWMEDGELQKKELTGDALTEFQRNFNDSKEPGKLAPGFFSDKDFTTLLRNHCGIKYISTDRELINTIRNHLGITAGKELFRKRNIGSWIGAAIGTVVGALSFGWLGFLVAGSVRGLYDLGVGFIFGYKHAENLAYQPSYSGHLFNYNRVVIKPSNQLISDEKGVLQFTYEETTNTYTLHRWDDENMPSPPVEINNENFLAYNYLDQLRRGVISATNRELIESIMKEAKISGLELSSSGDRGMGYFGAGFGAIAGLLVGTMRGFLGSLWGYTLYTAKAGTSFALYKEWEATYTHDSVQLFDEKQLPKRDEEKAHFTYDELSQNSQQLNVVKNANGAYTVYWIERGQRREYTLTSPADADAIAALETAESNHRFERHKTVLLKEQEEQKEGEESPDPIAKQLNQHPEQFVVVRSIVKVKKVEEKKNGSVEEKKPQQAPEYKYTVYWATNDSLQQRELEPSEVNLIAANFRDGSVLSDKVLNTSLRQGCNVPRVLDDRELVNIIRKHCKITGRPPVDGLGSAVGSFSGILPGVVFAAVGFTVAAVVRGVIAAVKGIGFGFNTGWNAGYFPSHRGLAFTHSSVSATVYDAEAKLPDNLEQGKLYLVQNAETRKYTAYWLNHKNEREQSEVLYKDQTEQLITQLKTGDISASNRTLIERIVSDANIPNFNLPSKIEQGAAYAFSPLSAIVGWALGTAVAFLKSGIEGAAYGTKLLADAPLYDKWKFTYTHSSVRFIEAKDATPTYDQLNEHPEQLVVRKKGERVSVYWIEDGKRQQQSFSLSGAATDVAKAFKDVKVDDWLNRHNSVRLLEGKLFDAEISGALNANPKEFIVVKSQVKLPEVKEVKEGVPQPKPSEQKYQYEIYWMDKKGNHRHRSLNNAELVLDAFKKLERDPAAVSNNEELNALFRRSCDVDVPPNVSSDTKLINSLRNQCKIKGKNELYPQNLWHRIKNGDSTSIGSGVGATIGFIFIGMPLGMLGFLVAGFRRFFHVAGQAFLAGFGGMLNVAFNRLYFEGGGKKPEDVKGHFDIFSLAVGGFVGFLLGGAVAAVIAPLQRPEKVVLYPLTALFAVLASPFIGFSKICKKPRFTDADQGDQVQKFKTLFSALDSMGDFTHGTSLDEKATGEDTHPHRTNIRKAFTFNQPGKAEEVLEELWAEYKAGEQAGQPINLFERTGAIIGDKIAKITEPEGLFWGESKQDKQVQILEYERIRNIIQGRLGGPGVSAEFKGNNIPAVPKDKKGDTSSLGWGSLFAGKETLDNRKLRNLDNSGNRLPDEPKHERRNSNSGK